MAMACVDSEGRTVAVKAACVFITACARRHNTA
nr:MAG TPA: hypothetical protein [Caudoviricetes sp.]